MQLTNVEWSQAEVQVAQAAYEKAYAREIAALVKNVQEKAIAIAGSADVWQLHDFLSVRRHEIDGKYDADPTALVFVLAQLLKEGWLHLEELEGLTIDKRTKVVALARM